MTDDRIEQALAQLFALTRDAVNQQNAFALRWADEHGKLAVMVAHLQEQIKAPAVCPEPARCSALEERVTIVEKLELRVLAVEKLEPRVLKTEQDSEDLRESRAAVQGGWKSVMLVASGIGGAAGFAAAVAMVVQWLKGSPPAHP
jgi:hypothetical protein